MSPTTNPGNLNTDLDKGEEQLAGQSQPRNLPWRIVVLGVVALTLAVFIGTQVLGVLYVIIFPPAPPLPGDLTLVRHTSADYGVDEWLYHSSQNACDVLTFYINSGGQCRIAPFQCGDVQTDNSSSGGSGSSGQNIATCTGESKVSIFAMRWEVIIATGPTPDISTAFRLSREVFWTGQVPPKQSLNDVYLSEP